VSDDNAHNVHRINLVLPEETYNKLEEIRKRALGPIPDKTKAIKQCIETCFGLALSPKSVVEPLPVAEPSDRTRYVVIREGNRACDHVFSKWDTRPYEGSLFCDWLCEKCDMKVAQLVGPRRSPKAVPQNSTVTRWNE